MRRNAFWGSIFRLVIYAALLLLPLWFYYTYMAPIVTQMLDTVDQIQGTGARAEAQFSDFQNAWRQFQDMMGASQN